MNQVDNRARAAGLLALFVVAACGSEKTTQETDIGTVPTAPKILNFEANPDHVLPGEKATLAWTTRDAVSIAIADGAGQPVPVDEAAVAQGTVEVAPTETTSYTLTASGPEGSPSPAYRTVTVAVREPAVPPPVIETFSTSKTKVLVGEEATLSWRTSHATAVTLKDDGGAVIDLAGAPAAEGSVVVRPTRSPTTYFLTATGVGPQASAHVTVDVDGLPRVHRFYVHPIEPVAAGGTVTLGWQTSRADRVVIEDDTGKTVVDSTQATGTHQLPLERTTEYLLTATGNGHEATAQVIARVAADIAAFTASPRIGRAGDPLTLAWQTSGADSVTITGPADFLHEVPAAEMAAGSLETTITESGDYILTAYLDSVAQTWSVFVEATEAPRVRSLVASESLVTAAPDRPHAITLTFVQDGATTCTLFRNDEVVPELAHFPCVEREQTVDVDVFGASDLRLVAENAAGTHHLAVHVDAVAPARIPVFAATPARRVATGATVTLDWEVTDATRVWMQKNGADFTIGSTEFSGSRSDDVAGDTTYTLHAENSLGDETTATVAVSAGPPVILEFAATLSRVVPGDPVTFVWTCDGGDSLSLVDQEAEEKKATDDHGEIDRGTVTFTAPEQPGTYVYTLRVENEAGESAEQTFSLDVTDGPLIRSFVASSPAVSTGSTLSLSWEVTDDAAGNPPTLALVDNFENEYELAGVDVHSGSVEIELETKGSYVFTLTASTEDTAPSTATVAVEVADAPRIDSFTVTPEELHTGVDALSVTLAWETHAAAELSLYTSDAKGQVYQPAILQRSLASGDPQEELDASSYVHAVPGTTYFVLRVTNAIGTTVEELVRVLVDPPVITSFEPADTDIILGESTTLTWTADNATVALLKPDEVTVTETANTFVDVSTLPGAQFIEIFTDNVFEIVEFPAGFRFPFDGKLHEAVRFVSNGFLSFDLENTGITTTNDAFPTPASSAYVHLAPFWDNLTMNHAGVEGSAYWHFDEVARTVTLMWKNWSYRAGTSNSQYVMDLNFAVVLHENGDFEFRYGPMVCNNTNTQLPCGTYERADYGSIGFQNLDASYGYTITDEDPIILDDRGWYFSYAHPATGSQVVTPTIDQTYQLLAANSDAEDIATTHVRVWPQPTIDLVSVYPSGPQAGVPFAVSWRNNNTNLVRVLDSSDNVLCEVTDPALVLEGSCSLTFEEAGNVTLTVVAVNGIERNHVTKQITFGVFPRLAVEAFVVSDPFISSGETITVTWQGVGGYDAELYECVPKTNHSVCTPIDIVNQDPNAGSYTTTLTESKEYWFRLVDQLSRSAEAITNVWVDIAEIESFTTSATQIAEGGSVDLAWQTSGATQVTFENLPLIREVTDEAPFVDIRGNGGVAVARNGTAESGVFKADFPPGFTFPWFGEEKTGFTAGVDGWINLDSSYTGTSHTSNYLLPSSTHAGVEIAPFWDGMTMRDNSEFHFGTGTDAEGVDYVVLQWSHMDFYSTSYGSPADLTFQAVLFEDGNVEFRYGPMISNASTGTQQDYALGKGATAGIQHYPSNFAPLLIYNAVVEDGLSNRSWRYDLTPRASGAVVAKPEESTTFRLCVTNDSLYDNCQEYRVVVVKPGDLLITEVMAAPTNEAGEWFEIRNLNRDPVDLGGFTLTSGTGEEYLVPAGDTVVASRSFAVLARSGNAADNGLASPKIVYGDSLTLNDAADEIRLVLDGTEIDKVAWTASWPIQPDKSIALETSIIEPNAAVNNASSAWCATTEVYAGTFSGSPGALGQSCDTSGGFGTFVLDTYSTMPFIDIRQTGTDVTAQVFPSSPYHSGPVPIGFAFPFYDRVITEMYVTKYGFVVLEPPTRTPSSSNSDFTSTSTMNSTVAPMWDTYYDRGNAQVHYHQLAVDGRKVAVVQWSNMGVYTSTNNLNYGLTTFQAQLWENGDIVFAYEGYVQPLPSYSNYRYIEGSSATIGIKDPVGNDYVKIYYGTGSSGGPAFDGRRYHFIRR